MRYLSLFSGIEACSVAWAPLGWECVAVAEIEPWPSRALAHHYPDVPNLGDVTKVTEEQIAALGRIDVVVFGSPCQDLSVAGKRKGLDGARSGLFFTAMQIVGWARHWCDCRFALWENVPGAFSSNAGRDFAAVVDAMAGLEGTEVPPKGWGTEGCALGAEAMVEWSTLDAQWFGVAQRRRRVFAIADFGDWRNRPPILLESEGVRGDTAPRRETGEDVAGTLTAGLGRRGGSPDCGSTPGLLRLVLSAEVGKTLCSGGHSNNPLDENLVVIPFDTTQITSKANYSNPKAGDPCHPLAAGAHPPAIAFNSNAQPDEMKFDEHVSAPLTCSQYSAVAETLYTQGIKQGVNDARTQKTHPGALLRTLLNEVGAEAFTQWGLGVFDSLQPSEILRRKVYGCGVRPAAFSRSWVVHCALSRPEDGSAWLLQSLREAGCEGCASQGLEPFEQLARQLRAYLSELSQPGAQAARFVHDLWQASEGVGLLRKALSAIQEVGRPAARQDEPAQSTYRVRRLIPTETEFLQGFPRGYTAIPTRGKPSADGPRYKALGNSMAVPVMRWIGQSIDYAMIWSSP